MYKRKRYTITMTEEAAKGWKYKAQKERTSVSGEIDKAGFEHYLEMEVKEIEKEGNK